MSPRHIPLHMLLLAGLISPARAADVPSAKAADAKAATQAPDSRARPSVQSAYAGLNALPPTDEERAALGDRLPAGAGLRVGLVDPEGPAVDQLQPGDMLVRLDDQLLVNFDQFRSLVQMRGPGETVKFSVLRNGSPMTIPVKLAVRPAGATDEPSSRSNALSPAEARQRQKTAGARTIQVGPGFVINLGPGAANLPPEIVQQLEELQQRGLAGAQGMAISGSSRARPRKPDSAADAVPGVSTSRSYSFHMGSSASTSTHLADAEGSVSVQEADGRRRATVKDAQGKVIFEGEVTTEEQLAKLPEEVRRRIKSVEGGVFSLPGVPAVPKAPAPEQKFDRKKGA